MMLGLPAAGGKALVSLGTGTAGCLDLLGPQRWRAGLVKQLILALVAETSVCLGLSQAVVGSAGLRCTELGLGFSSGL